MDQADADEQVFLNSGFKLKSSESPYIFLVSERWKMKAGHEVT